MDIKVTLLQKYGYKSNIVTDGMRMNDNRVLVNEPHWPISKR